MSRDQVAILAGAKPGAPGRFPGRLTRDCNHRRGSSSSAAQPTLEDAYAARPSGHLGPHAPEASGASSHLARPICPARSADASELKRSGHGLARSRPVQRRTAQTCRSRCASRVLSSRILGQARDSSALDDRRPPKLASRSKPSVARDGRTSETARARTRNGFAT